MGLIKLVASIIGILVLAVVGLGAFLWFTDYEAEGTITDKGSEAGGEYVVIRPKVIPRDIKVAVDEQAAQFVCEGYGVTYRIQSQHYRVLDQEGRLVYDSETGLNSAISPIRCATLGV